MLYINFSKSGKLNHENNISAISRDMRRFYEKHIGYHDNYAAVLWDKNIHSTKSQTVGAAWFDGQNWNCYRNLSNNTDKKDAKMISVFYGYLSEPDSLTAGYKHNPGITAGYAFQQHGTDCHKILCGEFVLLIYDVLNNRGFVIGDHLGLEPVYYTEQGDNIIVSTSLKIILRSLLRKPEINSRKLISILAHFHEHSVNYHTYYKSIYKLLPAHFIRLGKQGLHRERYWSLPGLGSQTGREDDWYPQKYRELLEQAVTASIGGEEKICTQFSAGLDSSAISFTAAKLLQSNQRLILASAVDKKIQATETAAGSNDSYQLIAEFNRAIELINPAKFLDCKMTPPDTETIHRLLDNLGYISGSGYSINNLNCYRQCRKLGVRVMLSGTGGDQATTIRGSDSYKRELVRQGRWKAMWRHMSQGDNKSLGRKLYIALTLFFMRHSSVFVSFNDWRLKLSRRSKTNYVDRFSAANKLLVRAHNIDHAWWNTYLNVTGKFSTFAAISHFLANIAVQCNNDKQISRFFGIDYRFPIISVPLVELAVSAPIEQHYNGGKGRYLASRALTGVVPDNILQLGRIKKSGFNSFPGFDERLAATKLEMAERYNYLRQKTNLVDYYMNGETVYAQLKGGKNMRFNHTALLIAEFLNWYDRYL